MDPSQPGPSNAAYAFTQPGGQLAAAYNPPPPAEQAPPGSYAAPAYATAPPAAAPQATPMYGQPPLPPPPLPPTQAFGGAPNSVALNIASRPTRQRRKPARYDEPNRATGPRPSKLKLNFSKKGVVGGRYSSFLGHYDREIDSDEEELEMEEHFILRMPGQGEADKLRALLRAKGKAKEGKKGKAKETAADESIEGVWFKFKDSRRAAFSLNGQLYSAKLVDLPSIIESQKTLDGKQMFKVADISQMLQVTHPISSEASVLEGGGGGNHSRLNIEEYIYPHGITPPLKHVRKRRYRKRVSRRTIEIVEEEVERLLDEDSKADQSTYDVIENADPDASDTEFLTPTGTPRPGQSEYGDEANYAHGQGGQGLDGSEMGDGDGTASRFGGTDGGFEGGPTGGADGFDLAAELTRGLKALDESGEDEDEDDDDDEDGEDDDDDDEDDDDDDDGSAADSEDEEAVQLAQRQKLLNEEIRDLEAAVAKKRVEIEKSANVIIRKRFEDALKKLQADLDLKLSARATNVKEKEKRKREEEEEKEREQAFRDAEKERAAEVALAAAASESRARQAQDLDDDDNVAVDEEGDAILSDGTPAPASSAAMRIVPPALAGQPSQVSSQSAAQGIESLMAAGLDAESSGDDEDDDEDLFGDDGTEDDEGSEVDMESNH